MPRTVDKTVEVITSPLPSPRPVTPHGLLAQQLTQLASQVDDVLAADGSLQQIAVKPSSSINEFKYSLKKAAQLAIGLDAYIESCTTPESPALKALTQKTQAEDWTRRFVNGETNGELEQEMLSGHTEGQFLKMLVSSLRAKRVLEVGLFTGYSALAMAEALPEDGVLIACELDKYAAEFAQSCFAESPHGHKIQVEVGPAIASMQQLAKAEERFDFVFIDANKDGYVDYLNLLLESSLLAPNGLICVDNTLMQGQPYMPGKSTANGQAIAQFNQFVAADDRVQQVLLPIRDGVTLIRRS
ncbi:MAG: class I SAM-dependent methyltransferase [Cyanobacteria bacterium J06560_5]